MNFNFKILFKISATFFLIVALLYFVLPKLEFSKPELNRGFGTFFNIFCVLFSVLLFLKIRTIKIKWISIICSVLNFVFLLGAILNFYIYSNKIDPQTQFFDITTIYRKKSQKNDKIISQYYVNWKTNKDIPTNNRVYDFGPFRYFVEYDIDTLKLDKKEWLKEN
jgi:hypothetical protein